MVRTGKADSSLILAQGSSLECLNSADFQENLLLRGSTRKENLKSFSSLS